MILEEELGRMGVEGGEFDSLKRRLVNFNQEAVEFLVFLKFTKIRNDVENRIKFPLVFDSTHQFPELSKAKEESFQIAKQIYDENMKLRERILIYKKQKINSFHSFVVEKSQQIGENEELDEIVKQFNDIKKRFEEMKMIELSGEELDKEIKKIDDNVAEKMKKLELIQREIEPIDVEEDAIFFRYRALKKEFQEINNSLKDIEMKLLREEDSFFSFCRYRLSSFYKTKNEIGSNLQETYLCAANKLFLFEITDRSFSFDKLIIERLEGTRRSLTAKLMYYQLFPPTPVKSYEQDIYLKLWDNFNEETEENTWINQLLIATT
uniref:Uncharacterized protein n=1 Tax=Caenorhabditis tropicalis TaxID=1561998 RepID=A0A1I7TFW5_9PELO